MSDDWVSLPQRMGWERPKVPVEGIPPWLLNSLDGWLESALDVFWRQFNDYDWALREVERRCWVRVSSKKRLMNLATDAPRHFLCALDALLALVRDEGRHLPALLEYQLAQAGSPWRVAIRGQRPCLERRVDEGVQAAADEAMGGEGAAAQLLRDAWHAMYGLSPNASEAYRDAVRAVEAAAQPLIIPADPMATLGKMIAAVRDAPGKWTVVLSAKDAVPIKVVQDMMQLLWQGQHDRHGKPDPDHPLDVSAEEAEAAVHLAATLVHWFRSGAVRLMDQDGS